MAKNFIQPGNVISVAAPAATASGEGVLVGSIFGVAQHGADIGAAVEIALTGVYDLAKAASQAWTVGVRIYWDDTAKVTTTAAASGANKLIGVATAAVGSGAGETVGRVLLTGAFTL